MGAEGWAVVGDAGWTAGGRGSEGRRPFGGRGSNDTHTTMSESPADLNDLKTGTLAEARWKLL